MMASGLYLVYDILHIHVPGQKHSQAKPVLRRQGTQGHEDLLACGVQLQGGGVRAVAQVT